MRRVPLLCLLTLASAIATSAQNQPEQQPQQQQSGKEPRPHQVQRVPRPNPQTPPRHYCKATDITSSYPRTPHLTKVNRTDGLAEYRGTLITWTPIDNETECHVRQLYFWADTLYQPSPSVDVNIQMTRHGSTNVVKERLNWDIISILDSGATLFRVDAEQVNIPASKKACEATSTSSSTSSAPPHRCSRVPRS